MWLNAVAVGILLFLVWDVLSAAWEPIDAALGDVHAGNGGLGTAVGYGLLFAVGLAVGLLSLVAYERWMARYNATAHETTAYHAVLSSSVSANAASMVTVGGSPSTPSTGTGPAHHGDPVARGLASWSSAQRLALLVIGFGLHNATEGFGIVAPLAAQQGDDGSHVRPSWGFLLGLGAIAGAPTFIGTWVGHSVTSEPLAVLFLTLAAGSILYVVMALLAIAMRAKRSDLVAQGLLIGLLAGFLTDAIVTAGGA